MKGHVDNKSFRSIIFTWNFRFCRKIFVAVSSLNLKILIEFLRKYINNNYHATARNEYKFSPKVLDLLRFPTNQDPSSHGTIWYSCTMWKSRDKTPTGCFHFRRERAWKIGGRGFRGNATIHGRSGLICLTSGGAPVSPSRTAPRVIYPE